MSDDRFDPVRDAVDRALAEARRDQAVLGALREQPRRILTDLGVQVADPPSDERTLHLQRCGWFTCFFDLTWCGDIPYTSGCPDYTCTGVTLVS